MTGRRPGPGSAAKDAFGPYVAWIVIAAIGFWPHFVWRGTAGWVVTGVWLCLIAGFGVLLAIGGRRAS